MKENNVYLHLSNSGVILSIEEGSYEEFTWPVIKLEMSTFGAMKSEITIDTSPEALKELGEMFLRLSNREFNPNEDMPSCRAISVVIDGEGYDIGRE